MKRAKYIQLISMSLALILMILGICFSCSKTNALSLYAGECQQGAVLHQISPDQNVAAISRNLRLSMTEVESSLLANRRLFRPVPLQQCFLQILILLTFICLLSSWRTYGTWHLSSTLSGFYILCFIHHKDGQKSFIF